MSVMKKRMMIAAALACAAMLGAAGITGIAARHVSTERVDDWRMQAMSTHQPLAVWCLRVAEAAGNPAARLALAHVLIASADTGDVRHGVDLLRQAARLGNARAQLQLGKLLLKGQPGIDVDYVESRHWLMKAAPKGPVNLPAVVREAPDLDDNPAGFAALYLASIYRNGYGVARNRQLAFYWLNRAALAGVPQAQFQLANVYREDGIVPRDDARALHWLTLASEAELAEANLALAIAYKNGELGLTADNDRYWSYVKETAHDYKHTVVH
ncbi:TPR repeat protein [Caballeronia udeis]|jgi:TPR repeat protein|uniref:TPR repeat protein n=2 Tax=Caballeronia udeis TaxID=1232866 RepID=A0ABW8MK58_9BURK